MTTENKPPASDVIEELEKFFSVPRLQKYRQSSDGSPSSMLDLYRWNFEVSYAFQIPLHFCELAVRNAISDTFCKVYGERWPWVGALLNSLDKYSRKLLIDSRKKFENKGTGKVVADLNFLFWERMLSRRQRRFWVDRVRYAFPNLPEGDTDHFRKILQGGVWKARQLRNRIAHHEPIFDHDLSQHLGIIFNIVGWRSEAASELLYSMENVSELLNEHPMFSYANSIVKKS